MTASPSPTAELESLLDALGPRTLFEALMDRFGPCELLSLGDAPDRWALWHARCPDNPAFSGEIPPILGRARTMHHFDPCRLLEPDTRSELREDARQRQRGGGWIPLDSDEESDGRLARPPRLTRPLTPPRRAARRGPTKPHID